MTVLKLHIKAGTDVSFSRELLIKFQGVGGDTKIKEKWQFHQRIVNKRQFCERTVEKT